MKQEIIIEQLHLEGITPEDKSAGKHEGKVIFVDNAVPGDVVDVRVYTNKKSFAKGTAIHWHKRSEHRQEPFCKHFSICGGCKWQDINYTSQVNFKQQIVEQAFKHIGQLNFPEMKIVGADEVQFFRNKLQYSFANKEAVADPAFRNGIRFHDSNALGYHIARFFDKIINIEECWLQAAPSNEIKNTIRDYAIKHQLTYYDQRMHHGLLRNLTIRLTSLNELMVIMSFSDWNEEAKALMLMLKESFPQLTSLMYNINQKRNDSNEGLDFICYHGRPYIFEQLGNLNEATFLDVFDGVPQFDIARDQLASGINIVDFLTANTTIFPSKGEARKMITGGGVSLNKQKIENEAQVVTIDHLINQKYLLVQKGKKNYFLIKA